MFVRVKTIKGRKYAYLEERYREGGKVKSRHIKYLGPVDKLSWRKMPRHMLPPKGDFDGDGVINIQDCRPLDYRLQDLPKRPYVVSDEGYVYEGLEGESHNDILRRHHIDAENWEQVGREMRARVYPDQKEVKINIPSEAETFHNNPIRQFQLEMLKDSLEKDAETNYTIKDYYGKKIGEIHSLKP